MPHAPTTASHGLASRRGSPTTLRARWRLSTAKHPSLAGHDRLARALARIVPYYEYDESRFFSADGAPASIAAMRCEAFETLGGRFAQQHPATLALTRAAQTTISDLQFTSRYRVPFQFSRRVREDRPADVCFARGTFNSHPYVMGAMQAFLTRLEMPETRALYTGLDERSAGSAPAD